MNQSFKNTFRLPYLFKLEGEDGDVELFLRTTEKLFEVSSRDPMGFRGVRTRFQPPQEVNEDEFCFYNARILETTAEATGVRCIIVESP